MTSGAIGSLTTSQALREAAARTASLLRDVQDPGAAAPGLNWTVSETAAHVVAELRDYVAFASGKGDAGAPLVPGGARPLRFGAPRPMPRSWHGSPNGTCPGWPT